MTQNKATWSADGSYLPEIEPHTKAKHQILEDYIERYIVTLCGNNRGQRKTVTFVDGFCGGGMYRDPENSHALWEGSPIRMIKRVHHALEIVKREKSKPDYYLDAKFIFIDWNQEHLDCLKNQIENAGLGHYLRDEKKCEFIKGKFESLKDRCITQVKQRKGSSFFFLDPFGWTDVSMATIRSIIHLGNSEILYTYMIEFISRFLSEKDKKLKDAYKNILEAEGYYQFANLYASDTNAKQTYLKDETYKLFRNQGDVRCVYSFAVLPNKTSPKYYLIHLASKPPAQREIKYTLWEHNTLDLVYQFEYGIYGLGFRSPDYYEQNLSIINIADENKRKCRENLIVNDLMPLIYSRPDGITFEELHNETMQKNPATWDDYEECIHQQRSELEFEVFRDGKITRAKKLKPGDVIMKSKQLHFMPKLK